MVGEVARWARWAIGFLKSEGSADKVLTNTILHIMYIPLLKREHHRYLWG